MRGVRSIWLEMNERREQSGKRRAIRLYRRRCGVSLSLTLTLYVKVSLSFSLIVVLRVRIVGLATHSCQLRKPQNDTDSGQDLITHSVACVGPCRCGDPSPRFLPNKSWHFYSPNYKFKYAPELLAAVIPTVIKKKEAVLLQQDVKGLQCEHNSPHNLRFPRRQRIKRAAVRVHRICRFHTFPFISCARSIQVAVG